MDATAPETTIASGPSGATTATTASVTFSGTDNVAVASYECQLDSASWAAFTSPQAYSGITPGAHTIRVRAKDTAGTVDPTPATATWTVTAPVILGNQTVETYVDQNGAQRLGVGDEWDDVLAVGAQQRVRPGRPRPLERHVHGARERVAARDVPGDVARRQLHRPRVPAVNGAADGLRR